MRRGVSSQKQTLSENAQWPFANEEFLIQHSYDYYLQGHLQNSTFSGVIWGIIAGQLNESTNHQFQYTVKQCREKFTRIRSLWKLYYKLLNTETGYGIDEHTKKITGEPERIAAVIDGNKEYARMLNSGIPRYDNCTEMFYRTYATGSHARSGCQGPLDSDDDETVRGSIKQVSGGKRASTEFMATSDQDCGPSNRSNKQYEPCNKGKVNKTESMTTVMQQIVGNDGG
ncbi:PREDICTED: uncharacterized protein LOC105951497 [Erythranthe guttata]|uniref:uncharacterized protein LOC105951497 n=1 Tax=Erythranthe guttata TaxID=4155 RepID=UPI00064D9E12|nr:PREDICTED: uncharacterized protein LOC105951497 [Erythranthe guttata]|eukprot:XP_012830409.1 PREDICTED: uncharacterized protein LOC105951497 [Erythranthe guttata]